MDDVSREDAAPAAATGPPTGTPEVWPTSGLAGDAVARDVPRPWVGAGYLSSGRAALSLAAASLVAIWLSSALLDTSVALTALAVALLPLPIYLALALWIDRFEPEPRGMLATAFFWGASIAVVLAGILNGMADSVVGTLLGSVVAGPMIEEALKAVIVFRFALRRPDEFDGVIDGLVYGAMVGLGFAVVENVEYYGRSLVAEGMGGLAVTFTLRGVVGPFSHPLFTAMTGLGLGLARQSARPWVTRWAPGVGLAVAITLHGLWNAGASMGCLFFVFYFLIMLPALAALLAVAFMALRREGRVIYDQLAIEVERGLLTTEELERLASVRGRLDAQYRAWGRGGRAAWRQQQTWHRAASELAFLRARTARGVQPPDPDLDNAYRATLAAGRL